MPAPTEVARAAKIATTNSPLASSQRRQTKVQYAEKEGAFKFISAKQEKDGEAYSSATASSGTSIPTGPVNGFWWDPAFDSFNTGATGGVDPAHFQGPQKTASGPVKVIRPFVLGSLVGSLGATIYQVFVFKPVYATVSSPFLVLLVYILGLAWEGVVPSTSEQGFDLREHAIASIVAIAASRGNLAVQTFGVQRLYYEKSRVDWPSAALGIFATAGLGCGIAGLFESFAALSPDIVFPLNLPVISLLKDLHSNTHSVYSPKQGLRLFGYTFGASFLYEVIPAYLSPVLTGVNVFCLSTQKAVRDVRVTITNVFGGASGNEGLGLLSLCFDWQFIGTSYATLPLGYQVNTWVGYALCYGAVMGLYYSNVTSKTLMIATAIFGEDGGVYDQSLILNEGFDIDRGLLGVVGLPKLATSALWTSVTANIALGSLITYAVLSLGWKAFWPFESCKYNNPLGSGSRHSSGHSHTRNTPGWWYIILTFLSLFAGLTVVLRQHLHGSHTGFLVAVVMGVLAVPTSTSLYGRLGSDFIFRHITKLVGAIFLPDRPLALLYVCPPSIGVHISVSHRAFSQFSLWSNSLVSTSVFATSQFKFGRDLDVPSKVVFVSLLWGLVLGGLVNYAVSESVIQHQSATLIAPTGLYMWSGQLMQTMNSEAMTWALARDLYSIQGPYYMVPFGLLIGLCLGLVQCGLGKAFPKVALFNGRIVMIPVIFTASSMMTYGNTSAVLSTIIVGLVSQLWFARKRGRDVFEAATTILGAALDGGSQSMVLLLSLSVFGAVGSYIPFLKWAGNNAGGNVDYCDPTS
ncbi:OPT superfamily oligopeptide transporter [Coprinellus micaceus]|uniref:OPT superfamily oligopeptide transporter n=1 Tax=Coprinellus micaceus TaxID=71717 RepID=A0A4Y7TLA5_COPMI|nr:OPT superfamily oligopeptide transporter [Coprinellus micaceus]